MSAPRGSALVLLAAAAATIALSVVPFGSTITYPFRIFVTYVHETSHVLATYATGGRAMGMNVSPDGSGVAYSRGGVGIIVSSAGYLGSTLFGGLLLLICGRPAVARNTLGLLGLGVLAVILVFVSFSWTPLLLAIALVAAVMGAAGAAERSRGMAVTLGIVAGGLALVLGVVLWRQGVHFAWVAGLGLAVGLVLAGRYLSPGAAHFLLGFLAVQCCLGAVQDLLTLVVISARSSTHSDAVNMQHLTGIPAIVWALLWTATSVVVLLFTLRHYVARAVEGGASSVSP